MFANGGRLLDAFDLAREYAGLPTFPEQARWVADFLGETLAPSPASAARAAAAARNREREEAEEAAKNADHQKKAAAFLAESGPVEAGSPGDLYLTQTRGLSRPADGWPDALRWHAGRECLVVVLSDEAGTPRTAQTIPLTPSGQRRTNAAGEKLHKTLLRGPRSGLFFRLPARDHQPLGVEGVAVAEGPETALSIWLATGLPTVALIGVGQRIQFPEGSIVFLARDDDPEGSPAEGAADRLRDELSRKCSVVDVWPWAKRLGDKSDFNDALLSAGPDHILHRFRDALGPVVTGPALGLPIEEARRKLARDVGATVREIVAAGRDDEGRFRSVLFPVGVGIGKTHAAFEEALRAHAEAKASRPVVVFVPNHGLASQAADRLRETGQRLGIKRLEVRVWKGRSQPGMCKAPERAALVRKAGLDPVAKWCKTLCPHREGCPYLAQTSAKADAWVFPHTNLFHQAPKPAKDPFLVVVDESFFSSARYDLNGPASFHTPGLSDAFRASAAAHSRFLRLADITLDVPAALKRVGEQLSLSAAPSAADEDALSRSADARVALTREYGLLNEIKQATEAGDTVCERVRVFPGDKDLLGGEVGPPRYSATGRKGIAEGWAAPALFLDATAPRRILREFVPNIEVRPAVRAAEPYVTRVFVEGLSWGGTAQKRAVSEHRERVAKGGEPPNPRAASVERILRTIRLHKTLVGPRGTVLVVTGKELADYLNELNRERAGTIPNGVTVSYRAVMPGRDDWKTVDAVVQFGRTLPPPGELETQARALTGSLRQEIPAEMGGESQLKGFRFPRITRRRLTTSGQLVEIGEYMHPDEVAGELLRELVDGQSIQTDGRGRGVSRTAKNPLTCFVYADTYPDELPLDVAMKDQTNGPVGEMLRSGGVVFLAPTAAVRFYPDAWKSLKAAEKAWELFPPRNPLRGLFKGRGGEITSAFVPVRFKQEGRGKRWVEAFVPRRAIEDFPADLERAFGGRVVVERLAPPPAPEPPPEEYSPLRIYDGPPVPDETLGRYYDPDLGLNVMWIQLPPIPPDWSGGASVLRSPGS